MRLIFFIGKFIFLCLIVNTKALAVRPFITDDARVVGYRLAQWESWLRIDKHSGQQWHMFAYGPHSRVEVTAGAVLGYDKPMHDRSAFSYAMPLLQAKYLIKEYQPNKLPGVALVAGTFLPGGKGAFVPEGYGSFAFTTISQCLGKGEQFLFHVNVGANYLFLNNEHKFVAIWGVGTQVRLLNNGLHFVGEVFSGDPYVSGTGMAYQAGFRHFISDMIQVDATFGKGVAGDNKMPFWGSIGARFVTAKFQKRKSPKL